MVFLGIDPGSRVTGYGAVRNTGSSLTWVEGGSIDVKSTQELSSRLIQIYTRLREVIEEVSPDVICIEKAFYGKNAGSALTLGHARGVILLAAGMSEASLVECSPREIKKCLVGNGGAAKEQVRYMVSRMLGIGMESSDLDMYDALAAAISGFQMQRGY